MNLKGIVMSDHPADLQHRQCIGKLMAKEKPQTILLISRGGDIFNDGISYSHALKIVGETLESEGRKTFTASVDLEFLSNFRYHLTEDNLDFIAINDRVVENYDINRRLDPLYASLMKTVQRYHSNFKMAEIRISGQSALKHYQVGISIGKAIESGNRSVWIIAEGYAGQGDAQLKTLLKEIKLEELFELIRKRKDPDFSFRTKGFLMALGAADGRRVQVSSLLEDTQSFCINYGFDAQKDGLTYSGLLGKLESKYNFNLTRPSNIYLELVHLTLKTVVREKRRIALGDFLENKNQEDKDKLLKLQKGVFISLYEHGELRGCMGTLNPVTDNLGEELIRNTIESALNDNRFAPVEEKDLAQLELVIDIIDEIVPIEDPAQLDPKQFGLIAEQGLSKGILLPDLGGIDTAEKQLNNVYRVGGIIPENQDIDPIYYSLIKTKRIKLN